MQNPRVQSPFAIYISTKGEVKFEELVLHAATDGAIGCSIIASGLCGLKWLALM